MRTNFRPQSRVRKQRFFKGSGVGAGIAIGTVYRHDSLYNVFVRILTIPVHKIKREQQRLSDASHKASLEINELKDKAKILPVAAQEELHYLLDAYQKMLKGSRLIRRVERRISTDRINAEAAIFKEIDIMEKAFSAMQDTYLSSRIDDIREVGNRLVRSLGNKSTSTFVSLPRNAVIISEELSPANTALLDPRQVAGVATVLGGKESHAAIMAKSLALPAVMAATGITSWARNGDTIIVDGGSGNIVLNPSDPVLAEYRKRRANFLRSRRALEKLSVLPAITIDGTKIKLEANIELPSEIKTTLKSGATGIGLLRTEFLFMNKPSLPNEEQQFEDLRNIILKLEGLPVTIRTLDIGADKLTDQANSPAGSNPSLGLRAVRYSLKHKKIFMEQLSAILRAGAHGPIRILIPMISSVQELRTVKLIINRVARRLIRKGVAISKHTPPLGVMIEVPGAALIAQELAVEADFFAIGTNDLTQYTLAIDRTDETVSHLYNPLHPAVLKLIKLTTEAAAWAGIPVSICGEMAGDKRVTALLLGLGIVELSMSAANIPEIKKTIRKLNLRNISRKARHAFNSADPDTIENFITSSSDK